VCAEFGVFFSLSGSSAWVPLGFGREDSFYFVAILNGKIVILSSNV